MNEGKKTGTAFTGMSGKSDPTKAKWSGKYKENEMSFAQGGLGGTGGGCAGGESLEEGKKKRSGIAKNGIAMFPDKGGPTAISRFNGAVGDATGVGTSAGAGTSGGATSGVAAGGGCAGGESLQEVLDRRTLENTRLKIARDCNIPAAGIQLYDNGRFHLYNISEYDANRIFTRLSMHPDYSNLTKTAGKYDFAHFNSHLQPNRKYNFTGIVKISTDESMDEGVKDLLGKVGSGIANAAKDAVRGGIQKAKDQNTIHNKIFSALQQTKANKKPLIFINDEAVLSNEKVEEQIKKLTFGTEIFTFNKTFKNAHSNESDLISKYLFKKGSEVDTERYKQAEQKILSDGLINYLAKIVDLNTPTKSDDENSAKAEQKDEKAIADIKNTCYCLYAGILDGQMKGLGESTSVADKFKKAVEQLKITTDMTKFAELDKCAKERGIEPAKEDQKLSDVLRNEVKMAIRYKKRLIFLFTDKEGREVAAIAQKDAAFDSFLKQCAEMDLTSSDALNLTGDVLNSRKIDKPDTNDAVDPAGEGDATGNLAGTTAEGLEENGENKMNLHDHDQQIDYILNELEKRLEWMIYDGICSHPQLEDNKIVLVCDPEVEIITEMKNIIHDVCDGTKAQIEDDGNEVTIDFNLYEDLSIPTDTEEDYVVDGFTAIPDEEDMVFTYPGDGRVQEDPYVMMQVIDDDIPFTDFDDGSPFEHNFDEEFEDDDTFDALSEAATKKLTQDQQTKLKDAMAKGDADGVAALANDFAAANDPAKAAKAKELGINLMA